MDIYFPAIYRKRIEYFEFFFLLNLGDFSQRVEKGDI